MMRRLRYLGLKWRAMAHLVLERRTAALALVEQMLREFPGDAYAMASRAHLLAQAGERTAALQAMEQLLQARPDAASHWGILVCSFLGGMRAVTWTQVAQYIMLIIAYMIPVVWLSVKQTGVPVPQVVYGYQLEKVTAREAQLINDPKELEVRKIFAERRDWPTSSRIRRPHWPPTAPPPRRRSPT